jgi:imidazoleglycerol-phosphate dehydratase
VAVDLGGRPYLVFNSGMKQQKVRDFDVQLLEEFFRAVSVQARLNLHINHRYGEDAHHVCESVFKGFARALRQAVENDPRETGVPSSKGTL